MVGGDLSKLAQHVPQDAPESGVLPIREWQEQTQAIREGGCALVRFVHLSEAARLYERCLGKLFGGDGRALVDDTAQDRDGFGCLSARVCRVSASQQGLGSEPVRPSNPVAMGPQALRPDLLELFDGLAGEGCRGREAFAP